MALLDQFALSTLTDALSTADDGQLMRRILQGALRALIEAEAESHIGAGLHERSAARTTHRNGTRDRVVATTAGDLAVKIPKMRTGSNFGDPAAAPRAHRPGPARGHHGGPRPRRLDPKGRRPGRGVGVQIRSASRARSYTTPGDVIVGGSTRGGWARHLPVEQQDAWMAMIDVEAAANP